MATLTGIRSLDAVTSADVLVVPGGFATRALESDERLLERIRAVDATTQWTTSVCTGSLLLAASGLLNGLEATTHWGAVDLLESLGATYVPRRVVIQGKLITAAGVSAGIDMALTLAARIAGDHGRRTDDATRAHRAKQREEAARRDGGGRTTRSG